MKVTVTLDSGHTHTIEPKMELALVLTGSPNTTGREFLATAAAEAARKAVRDMKTDSPGVPTYEEGPLQLKIGKRYRQRDGGITGALEANTPSTLGLGSQTIYPFRGRNDVGVARSWTDSGQYDRGGGSSDYDLVEEIK